MSRRRQVAVRAIIVLALLVTTGLGFRSLASPTPAFASSGSSEDAAATAYYRALLKNTPWLETYWDAQAGHYSRGSSSNGGSTADFNFVGVLGNAVLLKHGTYDESLAGLSRATLQDHTVRTIEYFAGTNRWVNPAGDWGAKIYFDSTFETYFVDAAKLMWSDLDAQTRQRIDTIIRDEANYVVSLGTNADPRSPGWTTNGLNGNYQGDTKLEEMGARTMPLATALAFLGDDPAASSWREWLDRWSTNMAGLPIADRVNPTLIDGRPVSQWNSAHNIYDTFIAENHGSYAPIYQEASGDYAGRNAAQFAMAGRAVPPVLGQIPNNAELWDTLSQTGTDAGVPEDFMVADRHHLYGKNVLSLAYESVVLGDPYQSEAERMLIDHLDPYQDYAPSGRLTKFSGQANYEPEARALVAEAYLIHDRRDLFGAAPKPITQGEYFAHESGTKDYGADVGLVAHQTPQSLAAAVTKAGFVKFPFLPGHDDWFFDVGGSQPAMLPSTSTVVASRTVKVSQAVRDGFDATATTIGTPDGKYAGFTTLPNGAAVYATTGTDYNEGALRYSNLTMPGVRGLDGNRTFYGAGGSFTLASGDGTASDGSGVGDGYQDVVTFPTANVRYVRMYGEQPATQYGYSLYSLEARNGQGGKDLAQGQPTTASSSDSRFPPESATDGNPSTRWAVASAARSNPHSYLTVDLGSSQQIDRTTLQWEEQAAYGARYDIQGSTDGTHWTNLASVAPTAPGRAVSGNWLNIDNRAGFVVRGSQNQIKAAPTQATLSAGPPSGSAGMVVEEYAQSATDTSLAAARAVPTGGPASLRASLAGGYLSLFDLSDQAIQHAQLQIPQGDQVTLFRGSQEIGQHQSTYDVDLAAASARVEAPRFELTRDAGAATPDIRADVIDSQHVRLTNLDHTAPAALTLTSSATREAHQVSIDPGATQTVSFHEGALTPTPNLATGRVTFPTSPLPSDMTDPGLAVDGNPATRWVPGAAGRMEVDLGSEQPIANAELQWVRSPVRPFNIEVSNDGINWTVAASSNGKDGRDVRHLLIGRTARYVAVQVSGWQPADAQLAELYLGP